MENCAPALDECQIRQLLADLYGLQAGSVKQLVGYDDKNYQIVDVKIVDNSHISDYQLEHGATLKLTNPTETAIEGLAEGQVALVARLHAHGLPCPRVLPLRDATLLTRRRLHAKSDDVSPQSDVLLPTTAVRLLSFVPGRTLQSAVNGAPVLLQVGRLVARYRSAVQDFTDAALRAHKHTWSMRCLDEVRAKADCLPEPSKVAAIRDCCALYGSRVEPVYDALPSGLIHSDFNESNVLVRPTTDDGGEFQVCGLLDFCDVHWGAWLIDVSTAILYMMLEAHKGSVRVPLLQVGAHVLAGYYEAGQSLSADELRLIRCCLLGRLAMSLTFGWFCCQQQPGNADYLLNTQAVGWQVLRLLADTNDRSLLDGWAQLAKSYYGVQLDY